MKLNHSNLKEQFEHEAKYHKLILAERNYLKRQDLYSEAYSKSFQLNNSKPKTENFGFAPYYYTVFRKLMNNKFVVDYGCWNGNSSLLFAKSAFKVIGVDVLASIINENNEKYSDIKNLTFTVLNLLGERIIPIDDGVVDVVFSNDVIEHLHPLDLVVHLIEVKRILKKGGIYICITPHQFVGPSDVSKYFLSKRSKSLGFHIIEYNYTQLQTIFTRYFPTKVYPISLYLSHKLKIGNFLTSKLIPIEWKVKLERVLYDAPNIIQRIFLNPITIIAYNY